MLFCTALKSSRYHLSYWLKCRDVFQASFGPRQIGLKYVNRLDIYGRPWKHCLRWYPSLISPASPKHPLHQSLTCFHTRSTVKFQSNFQNSFSQDRKNREILHPWFRRGTSFDKDWISVCAKTTTAFIKVWPKIQKQHFCTNSTAGHSALNKQHLSRYLDFNLWRIVIIFYLLKIRQFHCKSALRNGGFRGGNSERTAQMLHASDLVRVCIIPREGKKQWNFLPTFAKTVMAPSCHRSP